MSEDSDSQVHLSLLDRYAAEPPPPPVPGHPFVAEVMAGKRYVTYPFVCSFLFLSFRRNLGSVRVVDHRQWPVGPLVAAALVTLLFGWWGFPWGLFWTPLALFYLWQGGRDSTRDVLSRVIGAPEANRVLLMAPKVRPPASIWLVRLLILVPVLFAGSMLLEVVSASGHQ